MPTATSRTVSTDQGEVLELPRVVAYGRDVELTIVRSGDVLTIYPSAHTSRCSGAELVRALAELPRPDRTEARDADWWPEEPGL